VFAATAEGVDLARLLLDLLIVVVAARLAAELCELARIPAVLGEIAAGVLIGPSVASLIEVTGERGVSLGVLAEIGVLLLLVQVGMEMDIAELSKVGRASLFVAVIGVVLPFGGGAIVAGLLGEDAKTAIFIGAALTATSVGITARVFGDLRALATTEARIVLGAAVADDVLGLVILTVVVKVVTGGSVGVGTVAGTLGLAIAFLVATGVVGMLLAPKVFDAIHKRASSGGTIVVAALALTLAFAELADAAKLAFIIGAFMAGLAIGRSDHHERVARDLGSVGNILIPIFFVQIGVNADLGAMAKPSVLGTAALLTVVGVVGKLAAAAGAAGTRADKMTIGLGMIPRGEVGLIFASIGLANGVLDKDLYGALLVVVLVTTMMTPPLLRLRLGRRPADEAEFADESVVTPDGGWLEVVDGEVRLRALPPVSQTVSIAFHTAGMLDHAVPGSDVLDWFARSRAIPVPYDADDTPAFLAVLRAGGPRAWRFLEVIGVFERAIPEIAAALHRRRADIHDLDPLGALRFPVLEALREHQGDALAADDELVLAALAADVCEDAANDGVCIVDLVTRLGRVAEAELIARVVSDAYLLRSGLADPSVFEEHEILQLATHLASPIHARRAYLLAEGIDDLPHWKREALQERYELVEQALDHPELTGRDATSLAAARMQSAQRLAVSPEAAERLRHASTSYLLSHDPGELARQARLVEPLPRAGAVRVAVGQHAEPGSWQIDVACRDTNGLLAHLSQALAEAGLDVVSASIATWADGAVLDSFVVRTAVRPPARELALAIEASLRQRLAVPPVSGLTMEFEHDSLPWHTVCLVRGPDQDGALQAITAAFAAAGVVVHSARVSSSEGTISNRFTVSDRFNRKLDDDAAERVRAALEGAPAKSALARLLRR
jgi:Kef-type K+ transport system membrane component KefB